MKYVMLVLLLFLVACGNSDVPLPDRCREAGVAVTDDDVVTGTIVEEIQTFTVEDTMRQCQKPFQRVYGCTIALGFYVGEGDFHGEYRIIYMNQHAFARIHEQCHALYEEGGHILERINRY